MVLSLIDTVVLVFATVLFCFWISITFNPSSRLVHMKYLETLGNYKVNDELWLRIEKVKKQMEKHNNDVQKMASEIQELRKLQQRELHLQKVVVKPSNQIARSVVDQIPRPMSRKSQQQTGVLVMACDRSLAVKHILEQLLRYQPSAELFPIHLSQDCDDLETQRVVYSLNSTVFYMKQPDHSPIVVEPAHKNLGYEGYYKIARHFRFALRQMFDNFQYDAVIIVEDDLEIAPDFFEYFSATLPLLQRDASIWCVSSWNDNGKPGLISGDATKLYRSDFFPGLGWMLTKQVWRELEPKWHHCCWDDWMREPEQRKNRSCIRPEISRTAMSQFGENGTSGGLFYQQHLKTIQLNRAPVKFRQLDLRFLLKDNYDKLFLDEVYKTCTEISLKLVMMKTGFSSFSNLAPKCLRVPYSTDDQFDQATKFFNLMEDRKAGVPRTAYYGVVSFMFNGARAHLAPVNWTGYRRPGDVYKGVPIRSATLSSSIPQWFISSVEALWYTGADRSRAERSTIVYRP